MLKLVEVEFYPETPFEALAGVETLALHTPPDGPWHLLVIPWSWDVNLAGVMARPPSGHYIRRVTGGESFPHNEGSVYIALVGPRLGARPLPLKDIYEMALKLLEPMDPSPLLTSSKCGLRASVGKLAQRPLIEAVLSSDCMELLMDNVDIVGHESLERDMLNQDSLSRLSSKEWNWGPIESPTFKFSYSNKDGFYLEVEALLNPPILEDIRIFTNMFVYPPAQALLLVEQLKGAPPSPGAAFEFLNGWGTLVEFIGLEFGEIRDFLMDVFERLSEEAGL